MKIISHRGNLIGSNPERENNPGYIQSALDQGFEVEIDLWKIGEELFLGHDKPIYKVEPEYLKGKQFWIHCKNIEAAHYCSQVQELNAFWHQKDDISISTQKYLWTYPGKELTDKSIAVLPETSRDWEISQAYGICTDYPIRYKTAHPKELIPHFNENIIGWFTFPRLYKDMVNKFPSGSQFVEVGVYEGKSFAYLLVEMINSGKQFDITAVDSFTFLDYHTNENILVVFKRNMTPAGDTFKIINGQSDQSANNFEDKSLDFVFIDADHVYENVKKDIQAWLPKIKPGGIIAGHDYCEAHPGVIQAVHEVFADDFNKEYLDELVWVKEV